MYTLFYSPNACSLASHIALAESGLPYEVRRVNFAENEQRSPEYLKHNPNGRVPALVTEKGTLIESPAILAFIAQSAPDAKVAPLDDPFEFARMQGFNSFIASSLHVAYAHNKRGYRWADGQEALDAMKRKVVPNMRMYFGMVENDFLTGPWVLGEAYSVADPYLFTMADWLEGLGIDREEFPKVADHYRRMMERPAVQKALSVERPD
ncbi:MULTISPECIES: glutathione S-transferase family protein [Pseudorhizobium]|jgi:glutathione S-transferase|uniref:Glutathione S-transferase n=2 Tax=Pseudorhizobium TaxID=1903858 RepID=A0A7W9YYZ2_9HYPH|nr:MULTISPECIES: glutathione S-transferase family protein [Pseudorhizobium]MBB6180999.1 glutathione S-transferase [Pseudorhizobium flavum]CAD6601766.1 glutathione S-transferase family protein [Pseudorhizobium flavum]CAD7045228.1 glutathione S-transferase family protein [Pseudorhizobium halotolerans]